MRLRFVHLILIGAFAIAFVHLVAIPDFEIASAILAPIVLLALYWLASTGGAASQSALRDQFEANRAAGDTLGEPVSIGGARWTVSNGEYLIARHWGGGLEHPIPDRPTTWRIRHDAEGQHQINRFILIFLFSAAAPITIWANHDPTAALPNSSAWSDRIMLDIGIVGAFLVTAWEIAYREGWQSILGAMVLDKAVERPGKKAVEEQKAHGDARLATEEEAREAATGQAIRRSNVNRMEFIGPALTDSPAVEKRLVGDDGVDRPADETSGNIYLGRYYDPASDEPGSELLYRGDRHLLVFGPTGSGKGRRFLIPNLLHGLKEQSVIVIDPKGEAAALTAGARREMGHKVVILNPFDVRGLGSAGFNPLSFLDPKSPNFYDDAAAITEALIKIEGSDPHWSQSAQGLVVGLVMWEVMLAQMADRAPSLANIRRMLTAPNKDVGDQEPPKKSLTGLRGIAVLAAEEGGETISSLLGRFTGERDELASIQSTADTQTRWLLSAPMAGDLERDGIDFVSLKNSPTTVFVILPAEHLRTHSVWLRLVIVSALRSLYSPGGRRVVMLIDEMAALGHLAPLEDAFGLVRGYGVQIAAILQDLGQLKEIYKERWETFIANAGVAYAFAPNDLTTAEWMSKRSGQTTVVAKGVNQNTGTSIGEKSSSSEGTGMSDQQVARPLLLPHQFFGFEQGMGALWLAGLDHTVRFFAPDYSKIADCPAGNNSSTA